MTVRFANHRLVFYIALFLLSGSVLGLCAHLASEFLPNLHEDFTIFSLVVPSLTIFSLIVLLQWAQPSTEAVSLFLSGVLWLAMGAWATDIIGNIQCDAVGGNTIKTKSGTMPEQMWCREMKVIQAFSWMIFVLYSFGLIVLISLVSRAQAFGRLDIWTEPIRELPWFGEAPGYYNTTSNGTNTAYQAGMSQYPYPQTQPGHALVIQPNSNGGMPTITQMPMSSVG